jgi:hypothetical protein
MQERMRVAPFASFTVLVDSFISEFRFKLFVHWVLTHLSSDGWRYWFYRWFKRKGCFLASCDDFNPVLPHANEEHELIALWHCNLGTSLSVRIPELDWNDIHVNARHSFKWHWNGTRFVFPTVPPIPRVSTTVRSLLRPGQQAEYNFEWHQGQRGYFECEDSKGIQRMSPGSGR